MLTGLDHVIIGVKNLEQATEIFSRRLGLAASGGGIHPTGGTANRIIVIGDTYLELITIRDPAEAQQSMLERLAKGDGYVNFVLGSDNIQADSAAMKQRGITVVGPQGGELRSKDGRARSWLRMDIERPDMAQHYPFIIQHDSSGEERRFRLAGWTSPPPHPSGAVRVLSTTIVVENLEEASLRFQRIYGLEPSVPYDGEIDGWDATLVAFTLGNDYQCFELAAPLPASIDPAEGSGHIPEKGALRRYLQKFGESLCRMTLEVQHIEETRRYLDRQQVTYTYQERPRPVLWIHPDHACGAAIVLYQKAD
ncbi:MAG: VOC family protein [Ktedonobacteraceae bacterium]|nr:VOC family protein [Ktedonobacteraceae bacterium]